MRTSRLRPVTIKTNDDYGITTIMEYNVKVWRQKNAKAKGHFETYHVTDVEEDASFLEMLSMTS